MIRTVHIPLRGPVAAGAGGSAGNYTFTNGLSNDPRLEWYLQDLTPAQLQNALNGQAPSTTDIGATDYGHMASCSDPNEYDPAVCGPGGPENTGPLSGLFKLPEVPTSVWLIGGGILAAALLIPRGR